MYYAIPSSLQSIVDLAADPREGDEFHFHFFSEFLKALCVLGASENMLSGIRRHLRLLSSVKENGAEGAASLESLLRNHDLLLGPDLGGLANLFRSAVNDEEIFAEETIDFDGLDPSLKANLKPAGSAAKELSALDDVAVALGLPTDRVASCIFFDAATQWIGEETICQWMRARPHLENTLRLFEYREHLEQLSVAFVQHQLADVDLKDFALWLLSQFLSGRKALEPLERRLVDNILRKAELGTLATFEQAGFLN